MHVLCTSVYDLPKDLKSSYLGVLFTSYRKLELGVNRRLAVSVLLALNHTAVELEGKALDLPLCLRPKITHPVIGFGR